MKFETIKTDQALKMFRAMECASKGGIEFNPTIDDGRVTSLSLHVERRTLKISFAQYSTGLTFAVPEREKLTVWRVGGTMFGLRFFHDFPEGREMLAREWAEKLQEFEVGKPQIKVERIEDCPIAETNLVRLPDMPASPLAVYEDDSDMPF